MKSIYFEKDIPRVLATKASMRVCKPLLYTGLNAVRYNENLPDIQLPAPNWVRVRNIAAGVCGTDLSFFKSTTGTSIALEPMPGSERTYLGHETIGFVDEVGAGVVRLKKGDRVTMRAYMASCTTKDIQPPCRPCAEGNYCLCENYGEPSPHDLTNVGAGFGDYFLAPEEQLMAVAGDVSNDQALMIEPAAVSLHAVLTAPPAPGESVLVLGAGTIGLGIIQCLKIIEPNCTVYVMERIKAKQEFALKLGTDAVISGEPYAAIAEATGAKLYTGMFQNKMLIGGMDRIYDCVGTPWAIHNCLRWLRARGTLVKVGHHMNPTHYDETPVWWQELKIVGIDAHGMEMRDGKPVTSFEYAQDLIRSGQFKTEGFITHRYPLREYKEAFKLMMRNPPELIKVVLDCMDPSQN